MKKNKLLILSLISCLLLGTVGCNSTSTGNNTSTGSTVKGESAVGTSGSSAWKPTKNVNVVVAYKAGSGTDTGARILCAVGEKYVGKTLVVVNKEGGDGKIGYTELVNAKPDGYTIGFINMPTYASLSVQQHAPFQEDSVTPICNHLTEPSCIVVRKHSKFKAIEDLIQYCKDHPGKMKCSTNGEKASNHIGIQLLAKAADFTVNNVPYGSTADQLLALRENEVDLSSAKIGDVATLIGENGELKMLATYTDERLPEYPDVPTLKEKGYDITYGSYRSLVGPKGMPQEIVDFYNNAFKQTMEDPENVKKSKNAGLTVNYMGPDDLKTFIHSQFDFANKTLPGLFN